MRWRYKTVRGQSTYHLPPDCRVDEVVVPQALDDPEFSLAHLSHFPEQSFLGFPASFVVEPGLIRLWPCPSEEVVFEVYQWPWYVRLWKRLCAAFDKIVPPSLWL